MLRGWPGMRGGLAEVPAPEARDASRTLGAWATRVVEQRGREGRRDASEVSRLRAHILADPIGEVYVVDVSTRDVRDWLSRRMTSVTATRGRYEGEGRARRVLSRSTIQNALNLIRVVLEEAVLAGTIDTNPAREVRVPRYRSHYEDRSQAKDGRALTFTEMRTLVSSPMAKELRARIVLTLDAGWRLQEMAALRVADVEIAGDYRVTVHVRASMKAGRRGPTKSGRGRRVVLGEEAARLMVWWMDHATRGKDGAELLEARLFPGGKWTARLGDVAARAGLGRVGWHDLRYTSACGWEAGWWGERMTVRDIQKRLGHRSVVTTERYLRMRASP